MRNAIAIFKREVLSFFVSPVAYFVITGFVLLAAYFFFNLLFIYNVWLAKFAQMPQMMGDVRPNLNQIVVENFFQTILLILVFLVPILTMRTIAEEKRSGTFELLITSPLSVRQIVLGKFMGVGFVLMVMLLGALAFPAILCIYGNPEIKPILSGFLATVLAGFAFASIGMAVSAFTSNQVVAGVTSMVALLLLYVIHSPAESADGAVRAVLEFLSPPLQAREMIKGVISLDTLVYFCSLIFLGLTLSARALDSERYR